MEQSKTDLKSVKNQAKLEVEKAEDLNQLNQVFRKYLGKDGEITYVLRSRKNYLKKKEQRLAKKPMKLKNF